MEALSVKDYRKNLAASFDRAAVGEQVIIRRKNKLYALVSLGNESITLSNEQEKQFKKMTESLKRSLNEVKQIEAGKQSARSALDFINEL